MKYGLSEEQLKQILDIIASYDEIEEAILFGSRAIDTYKEASDVDIAIKGKKVTASLAAKLKYRFEEDTYLPFFFDFIAYSTITNEALKQHIDTKGVSIYRAGWKECKLGEVAEIQTGPFGSQLHASDYISIGIPSIMPTNIGNRLEINRNNIACIKKVDVERLKRYLVKEGDIVYSRRGDVEKCAFITTYESGWLCGTGCLRIRFDREKIIPKYCAYYLSTDETKGWVSGHAVGTTMQNLNSDILSNIPVVLPPIPEQKAIASVLSSLDDKIDLLHRQNKTLETLAETLFRQWFMKQAETDDVATLGEFAQNIKENARVEDLQKYDHYVGLEHIPRKSIALTSWGKPDKLESNKSVFAERDILFGKLRAYFHKIVFAPIDGVCSTDILVIRPKKIEWFSFCLFWFFNTDVVEHSDLGSGGTRMPRTNWEILSGYQIPRPSYQRISEFDKIVRPMTENITFNISQIRTIEKLRDTLLPKLMSGKVRVIL